MSLSVDIIKYHQNNSSLSRFMELESTLEIAFTTIPRSFFISVTKAGLFEQGKVGRSEGCKAQVLGSDRWEVTYYY